MDGLKRVASLPAMLLWSRWCERGLKQVARPQDATHTRAQAHRQGDNADWILIVGNGAARGWGVESHDLALPGQLARQLTLISGRDTDVDLLDARDTAAITRTVVGVADSHYDAMIVVGGVNDALRLRSPAAWRTSMGHLLEELTGRSGVRSHVVVVGIPPIRAISVFDSRLGGVAAAHAEVLNAITAELCGRLLHVSFLPLTAAIIASGPEEHRRPENYRLWGKAVAEHLFPFLSPSAPQEPHRSLDGELDSVQRPNEKARQAAVDAVKASTVGQPGEPSKPGELSGPPAQDELAHIVAAVRVAYNMPSAAFTLIDGETQRYQATAGAKMPVLTRSQSACDIAMHYSGPTVVSDTHSDPRFRHIDALRFYAGHPIVSPAGLPIGMLCVVDSQPHDGTHFDTTMLRELALLLQRRLWAGERQN